MTSVQLFHRIARRARGGDFTKLSLTEQTDIFQAANAAVQRVYNALPVYFKEQTVGFALPGPKSVTLDMTQYSNTVSSDAFAPEQLGQSIVLPGDPAWNQIIGTNTLLNPYMGPTGTVTGTIYGNAYYSPQYPFERVIGNPRFADQNQWPMMRTEMAKGSDAGWLFQQDVGRPQCWWAQPMGNSQGNEPLIVIRFAPAPDQAYSMNVRLGFWPKRLTLADVANATTIPVPDQFLETALIPIAINELVSTPIWESRKDEEDVSRRAAEADVYLRMQVQQVAAPSNKVYTPIGF